MSLNKYFITMAGCIRYDKLQDLKDVDNLPVAYLKGTKIIYNGTIFEVHDNGLLFYKDSVNIHAEPVLWNKLWVEDNTYELENDDEAILLYELNYT